MAIFALNYYVVYVLLIKHFSKFSLFLKHLHKKMQILIDILDVAMTGFQGHV